MSNANQGAVHMGMSVTRPLLWRDSGRSAGNKKIGEYVCETFSGFRDPEYRDILCYFINAITALPMSDPCQNFGFGPIQSMDDLPYLICWRSSNVRWRLKCWHCLWPACSCGEPLIHRLRSADVNQKGRGCSTSNSSSPGRRTIQDSYHLLVDLLAYFFRGIEGFSSQRNRL